MDVIQYRKDFPLLVKTGNIYLDNAATSQRPRCVLDAETEFYERHNANPLRGFYPLAVEATDAYEKQEKWRRTLSMPSSPVKLFLQEIPRKASTWWHTATA